MMPDDEGNMTDAEFEAEMLANFAEYQLHKPTKWDDSCGYDLDDPKHPTWAERFADRVDEARMRAKERGDV